MHISGEGEWGTTFIGGLNTKPLYPMLRMLAPSMDKPRKPRTTTLDEQQVSAE
jgi:hypothetical protein